MTTEARIRRGAVALLLFAFASGCDAFGPDNLPPTVTITRPWGGQLFRAGEVVEIAVDASDADGTVRHVTLYVDGGVFGQDDTPPYEWSWTTENTPVLHHLIEAVAEDDRGAESTDAVRVDTRWSYQRPEETSDGWETASLDDVGMDAALLEELVNTLYGTRDHLVHGIVIIRHGKLVFEQYFPGLAHPILGAYPVVFARDSLHVQSSATKSFTSALLGIAIDRGFIQGVDQKVSDFFPEFPWLATGEKAELTLEHMITMSAGLLWDQIGYPILDPRNDIGVFQRASNPWELYLSRPLLTTPGEHFHYSEACINVVGEAIKRASGSRLDHFAEQFLFTPLGIDRFWMYLVWGHEDRIWASGDLMVRPRDMAKLGQLYLQGGVWDGEQIVPADWVARSGLPYHTFSRRADGDVGYGYAWWVKDEDFGSGTHHASGWGDQRIFVMPEYDMVVIHTGGSYYERPSIYGYEVVLDYVIPSIR